MPILADQRLLQRGAIIAFSAIFFAAFLLIAAVWILQGLSTELLRDPAQWLRSIDKAIAVESVSNAADLLAAILAIAITVVAIVVELAANRYSHRITSLFVREPINIIVMGFFVVATIHSIWVSFSIGDNETAMIIPNAGFISSVLLVTVALIILLPYFAFVMSFLSPVNVIGKIKKSATRSFDIKHRSRTSLSKSRFQQRIDELQDIARRAAEQSDRAVAMASINALYEVLLEYQEVVTDMPDDWFQVCDIVSSDTDFVSLSENSLKDIEKKKIWVDVKVVRQYLNFVLGTDSKTRDTTYVIAINTKQIGIAAIGSRPNILYRPELIDLCIRCFNSYLRATINNRDQRTGYYIMNQYRQFAEALLHAGNEKFVEAIAEHLQFYGLMGFKMKMPFLLEVAAYDISRLTEECDRQKSSVTDKLLDLFVELDQETKEDLNAESLLGVRRAQIMLAVHFLEIGDQRRASRICGDLREEKAERLERVRTMLLSEDRPNYWEFTDRGVNFYYLEPELHGHLETVFKWLADHPQESQIDDRL